MQLGVAKEMQMLMEPSSDDVDWQKAQIGG